MLSTEIFGSELRLARIVNGFTKEDVASHFGKTRQYIHKLETTRRTTLNYNFVMELANFLNIKPEMLSGNHPYVIKNKYDLFSSTPHYLLAEQFHFRCLRTAKSSVRDQVQVRGELIVRIINTIEEHMKLPKYTLSDMNLIGFDINNPNDIERLAEKCRNEWNLGLGAISNMHRLAEHLGIVVTSFPSIFRDVDALSIDSQRPIIVMPTAEESICRQRFNIGHEIGHLIMHQGVSTGDRITENQAHRFASALLIPRSMMAKLFPKPRGLRSPRFNWEEISEFKQYWKVSKSAILYRAKQLDLITEDQYKSAVISLRNNGESKIESEDNLIDRESPELLQNAFKHLEVKKKIYSEDIADSIGITVPLLENIIGFDLSRKPIVSSKLSLVE